MNTEEGQPKKYCWSPMPAFQKLKENSGTSVSDSLLVMDTEEGIPKKVNLRNIAAVHHHHSKIQGS